MLFSIGLLRQQLRKISYSLCDPDWPGRNAGRYDFVKKFVNPFVTGSSKGLKNARKEANMKAKAITVILTSMLALLWSAAGWAAERSDRRHNQQSPAIARHQFNRQPSAAANDRAMRSVQRRSDVQTRRIQQGIRRGELTRPEAGSLMRQQRRVNRAYDRALSDGRLDRHERWQLNRLQDRTSRHIYRFKHNPVDRYGRYGHRDSWRYYHRPGALHSQNVYNNYYPAAESNDSESYSLSAGASDTGWQFDVSTTINR
jgi:hypothetical protein